MVRMVENSSVENPSFFQTVLNISRFRMRSFVPDRIKSEVLLQTDFWSREFRFRRLCLSCTCQATKYHSRGLHAHKLLHSVLLFWYVRAWNDLSSLSKNAKIPSSGDFISTYCFIGSLWALRACCISVSTPDFWNWLDSHLLFVWGHKSDDCNYTSFESCIEASRAAKLQTTPSPSLYIV